MAPSTCYYFSLSSNPWIASKQTGSKTHLFYYVYYYLLLIGGSYLMSCYHKDTAVFLPPPPVHFLVLFFFLVLSLCSWFMKKNAVYGFLMLRYLIKIPVHLPRLRSMSHAGPLWWHHIVVEAFPFGRLADLCLRDRTPSLHPHTAHILANTYLLLSTGNFSRGLWSIHSCSLSTHSHFSPASSVFPTEVYK